MSASENPHISSQRISEIVSGDAPNAYESVHLANCRQCLRPIEKEALLKKAIADFRRRQKDESDLPEPTEYKN